MPHVDFPQTVCRAGLARRDITPPSGIYHRMWGAATHDRATGVHRPLSATALAVAPLAGGRQTAPQVIVAVDHCLLWQEEMESLRAAAARHGGIETRQLHVAFSHTHGAGLMDPARADVPGGELIADYLAALGRHVGEAAAQAVAEMRPANIVYGHGRCELAQHRDCWDEDSQQYVCGFNRSGPRDDAVLVARVTDEQSRTLGTLVNYACHPTTLAWDNTLISPDYVGAMREVVEQATGAPCVFLQGAAGDLGPRHGFVGDVAVADQNGRELGYAALAALESLPRPLLRFEYSGPVVSGATLGTWAHRPLPPDQAGEKSTWRCRELSIDLSYRPDLPNREETQSQLARWQAEQRAALAAGDGPRARDCGAQAERMARQLARLRGAQGDHLSLTVSICQCGDAFWLLLPGEYYNLLQRSLRARFPNRALVIATVTDGWRPGYLPTADTYGQGIYQESIALVARGSLETVIDRVGEELSSMLAGQPSDPSPVAR